MSHPVAGCREKTAACSVQPTPKPPAGEAQAAQAGAHLVHLALALALGAAITAAVAAARRTRHQRQPPARGCPATRRGTGAAQASAARAAAG